MDLRKLDAEVEIITSIWILIKEWQDSWESWRKGNFWKLNIDIMEDTAMALYKEFRDLSRKYYTKNWEMLEVTTKTLDGFRKTLPLITALKNPCMRTRHWDRVRAVMNT